MTEIVISIAAASLWFVFAIWTRKNWLNFAVKLFFLAISIATTVEALKSFGWVIQP